MAIGLDTDFFLALMKGHPDAAETWSIIAKYEHLVVSVVTIGEILQLAHRVGKMEEGDAMVQGIVHTTDVVKTSVTIMKDAVSLCFDQHIPYLDAIVLSTFMRKKCSQIHTGEKGWGERFGTDSLTFRVWEVS